MEINLLVLRSRDPKKLSEFYTDLGINFLYHRHGKGPFHYSGKIGKLVFEIYPKRINLDAADGVRLGFEIPNLDEKFIELADKGVKIVRYPKESEWGYFGIIEDLDGRKIELKMPAANNA